VVDKDRILDGSAIRPGDYVLALASNGLHTNGYTLVRALMAQDPKLAETVMPADDYNRKGGSEPNSFKPGSPETFFEVIMRPHTAYYPAMKGLFTHPGMRSMAHITGGGIQDNLNRILPAGTCARIDRGAIKTLPLFREIKRRGHVDEDEMLRTFNCGVGLCIVCAPEAVDHFIHHLKVLGHDCYPIGQIVPASAEHPDQAIAYHGTLAWD
jgi:phosphoribosylformylglycinamidine cyclo-ligase